MESRGRLMDLGITPGSEVTFVRRVPFSAAVQVSVRNARLVLRDAIANSISVQVV